MKNVQIKVNDYYGNPSYYSVMPETIFDTLELASLKGEEFADVDNEAFEKMVAAYKEKMKL